MGGRRDDDDDKIHVSSIVYNLAGPEGDRINFLKSLVVGAVQKDAPIAGAIQAGYRDGPGSRYKRFAHWAQNNEQFLSDFGTTSGKLQSIPTVDLAVVRDALSSTLAGDGQACDNVESAEIHQARIRFWVLQYMYQHYKEADPLAVDYEPIPKPAPFKGASTYTFNPSTKAVVITLKDGSTLATFTASSFDSDPTAKFLYAKYTPCIPAQELSISYGSYVTLVEGVDADPTFPSPWLRVTDDTAGDTTANVTATDALDSTFSDGRAATHKDYTPIVTAVSGPATYVHYIQNSDPDVDSDGAHFTTRTHFEFWVDWVVDTKVETTVSTTTLPSGTVRTDTITRTTEYLKKVRKTRTSTQKIICKTMLDPQWLVYKKGSGNDDFDAEMADADDTDLGFFYPPIPFRYDNAPIGSEQNTATQWLIHVGHLGFDWDDSFYDPILDSNARDIQVASSNDSDATWVSLKFIEDYTAGYGGEGWFQVRAREADDNDDLANADDVLWPLYRVFSKTTVTNPGYFRIRVYDQDSGHPDDWTVVPGSTTKLLDVPQPRTDGLSYYAQQVYPIAKKAFKKATGSNFDTVQNSILDNDNIKDIDYAYAVFGVSLNVKEDACKKYIYRFLLHLMQQGVIDESTNRTDYDEFMEAYEAAHQSQLDWKDWWMATHNTDGTPIVTHSDDGTHTIDPPPEPEKLDYPTFEWKTLSVDSVHEGLSDYQTGLSWAFIDENRGHGTLTKPAIPPTTEGGSDGEAARDAKPGELFFKTESNPVETLTPTGFDPGPQDVRTPSCYMQLNNCVTLNWQVTSNTWRQLKIVGMNYTNEIYKDHSVSYSASGAVSWTKVNHGVDDDGNPTEDDTGLYEESPFIFPLHGTVFKEMSLVDATQMANACTFIMFNSYTEKVDHWYESTWFKVILIVVIVVISIVAAFFTGGSSIGAGGAAVAGLVGVAEGTAAYIIIGALADIAIGMAVSYLATYLATKIFGAEVGGIVGAIVGLAFGAFSGGGMDGLTKLFTSAEGWMSLGIALTNGTAAILSGQARQEMIDMAKMMEKANVQSARIQELFNKFNEQNKIDPVAVNKYINEALEKPDMFIQRTLMTGSDIVDATLAQVDDFVGDRLQLVLP